MEISVDGKVCEPTKEELEQQYHLFNAKRFIDRLNNTQKETLFNNTLNELLKDLKLLESDLKEYDDLFGDDEK